MRGVCAECGDTKPLGADGVCENRHGCEHRQFQHEAAVERLEAQFQRLDRQEQKRWLFAQHYGAGEAMIADWLRHPSSRDFREHTNIWLDNWLKGEDTDGNDLD